jgi:response regulator RpfG family c-di-GMP phosphodiesterase
MEIIYKDSGAHFDPDIVEAFMRVADEFQSVQTTKIKEEILP